MARLTASGGTVEAVRIFVDGKLAAEDAGDGPETPGRVRARSVQASVPGSVAGTLPPA